MKVRIQTVIITGIIFLGIGIIFLINVKKAVALTNCLNGVFKGQYTSFSVLYNRWETEFDSTSFFYQEIRNSLSSLFSSLKHSDLSNPINLVRGDVDKVFYISFFDKDLFLLEAHFGYATAKKIVSIQVFDTKNYSIVKWYRVDGEQMSSLISLLESIEKASKQ